VGASRDPGGVDGESLTDFWIDEDRPTSEAVVLAVHGEADMQAATELKDRLGEAMSESPSAIVLDLSGATFLDSATLGVLLEARKRLRAQGGRFRVVAPRAEIRRIFELTLLDRVFELDASRQEALAASRDGRSTTAA
jgi:anti-sigma B factor antagonist